jgi:phosphopantothenoylcysteine decarboxylase/phosphopantothenate--cysteine ligase
MGAALAEEALARGAGVTVIQGMDKGVVVPADPLATGRLRVIPVETAEEMLTECLRYLPESTGVLATAAVMDYRVRETATGKLKRMASDTTLSLTPSVDVLKALREQAKAETWFLGFAAETDQIIENGREKLKRKRLDWLFANEVARAGEKLDRGFGGSANQGVLLGRDGTELQVPEASKREVARHILDAIVPRLGGAR